MPRVLFHLLAFDRYRIDDNACLSFFPFLLLRPTRKILPSRRSFSSVPPQKSSSLYLLIRDLHSDDKNYGGTDCIRKRQQNRYLLHTARTEPNVALVQLMFNLRLCKVKRKKNACARIYKCIAKVLFFFCNVERIVSILNK